MSYRGESGLPTLFVEGFFQFLTVLLLFVSLLWDQKGLIYLALLILVMTNGARLWCRLSLRGVAASLHLDREKVFPGEKIRLSGEVENRRFLPVWMQVEVPFARGFSSPAGEEMLSGESGVLWKEKILWNWELTAQRRGCYQVGPLNLISGDLLGFFQQKKAMIPSTWITVFPRIVPLKPLTVAREEFFGKQGAKNPVEDPVYPVATRDYRPGRPARHIHWKASLRHNRLQEKIFEPTSRKKVLLAIEVGQFQDREDEEGFEAVLEAAASLAVRFNLQGSSFGLVSNGRTFRGNPAVLPLSGGEDQLEGLLTILAGLRMETARPLAGMLHEFQDLIRGSSCVCFACTAEKETQETAEMLRAQKIPAAFVLKDPGRKIPEMTAGHLYRLDEIYGGSEAGA